MMTHPFLASRLFGTPILAEPRKAEVVARVLAPRLGLGQQVEIRSDAPPADQSFWASPPPASRFGAPTLGPLQESAMRESCGGNGYLLDPLNGIAVIEVKGTLVHKSGHIRASSGELGYDGLAAQLTGALEDSRVRGILLDCHSAGGEVAGCFQFADRVREAGEAKPVIALADEMAYSAAYAIAAAADEVWLASETSGVGSIGAILLHVDFTGALDDAGIKVTVLRSGDRKAEFNPFEALSDDVRAREQRELDQVRDLFVRRVADWRDLPEDTVYGTEAGTYTGRDALGIGLADGIGAPEDVYDAFAQRLRELSAVPAA